MQITLTFFIMLLGGLTLKKFSSIFFSFHLVEGSGQYRTQGMVFRTWFLTNAASTFTSPLRTHVRTRVRQEWWTMSSGLWISWKQCTKNRWGKTNSERVFSLCCVSGWAEERLTLREFFLCAACRGGLGIKRCDLFWSAYSLYVAHDLLSKRYRCSFIFPGP